MIFSGETYVEPYYYSMDKIRINNIELYAYHGVAPEENRLGQKFQIDVEISTDLTSGTNTDDIKESTDYQEIFNTVSEVFVKPTSKLIETAANRVAGELLKMKTITDVRIKVRKPSAPLKGICSSVEVEIFRSKIL